MLKSEHCLTLIKEKSKNCQEGSSKYRKEVEGRNPCFGRQLSQGCILCVSDKKAEIDRLAAEYIESVKNMVPEERVEHLKKIQSAYSKCKEYSDDKVQLAMQTYEMVRITTSETSANWSCFGTGLLLDVEDASTAFVFHDVFMVLLKCLTETNY